MSRKLLLIGGGGHCKSVLDSVLQENSYDEIGIIDRAEKIGMDIMHIPIIGCDDDLNTFYRNGYHYAFVTLGSIGNPENRIKLFRMLEDTGFYIPNIIDPTAMVSNYVKLSKGIYIGKNVVINAGTVIGKGAIINTSSSIDHDCRIGEFSHISPGVVLCGEVEVGTNTHIGAKSVVKQQVKIGSNTLIGMGSTVLKNITDSVIAFGSPCREVETP